MNDTSIKCPICGNDFIPSRSTQKFCTKKCRAAQQRQYAREYAKHRKIKHEQIQCSECGKMFTPLRRGHCTCSKECSAARAKRVYASYGEKKKREEALKRITPAKRFKSLKEISAAASREHLTYGQYVSKYGL